MQVVVVVLVVITGCIAGCSCSSSCGSSCWCSCRCSCIVTVTEIEETATVLAPVITEFIVVVATMDGISTATSWLGRLSYSKFGLIISDNRTILVQNDVFKNDMLHMVYPSMYRYGKEYLSRPGHVSSHGKEHQSNETTNGKQGDISNNLANFQHEYESLMRQQSEKDKQSKDTQPGNEISKLVPIHSFPSSHPNAPQRIFAPPTSTGFYISGPPVKHGEPFQSVLQQPQNLLPVMLNSPVTLPYPCPITPNHPIPYRVGF